MAIGVKSADAQLLELEDASKLAGAVAGVSAARNVTVIKPSVIASEDTKR